MNTKIISIIKIICFFSFINIADLIYCDLIFYTIFRIHRFWKIVLRNFYIANFVTAELSINRRSIN